MKTTAEYVKEALDALQSMTPQDKADFAKEVSRGFNDEINESNRFNQRPRIAHELL